MAFTTRMATVADHPSFVRLFAELHVPDPVPGAEAFAAEMLPRVLLLCEDGATVGYASWRLYGPTAHVVHVVVDPGWRGRGGGRALLAAVRAAVVRAGCTRWYLNVKRDNAPALALYRRCGFAVERESWAMRIGWAEVDAIAAEGAAAPCSPAPADDAAIAARFGLPPERLAMLRARPGTALVALREQGEIVAFAAFAPSYPGAYPFCAARPGLLRALLDACRAHADRERFDFVRVTVEGDAALERALAAAGAQVSFALFQMGASLAAAG